MISLLQDYENRLILFGGRSEIDVDLPDRYVNDGWHTDFYYGFKAVAEIRREYPPECDVKFILITDGVQDSFAEDYPEERFEPRAPGPILRPGQTYPAIWKASGFRLTSFYLATSTIPTRLNKCPSKPTAWPGPIRWWKSV